jgi:hypothetical protein
MKAQCVTVEAGVGSRIKSAVKLLYKSTSVQFNLATLGAVTDAVEAPKATQYITNLSPTETLPPYGIVTVPAALSRTIPKVL